MSEKACFHQLQKKLEGMAMYAKGPKHWQVKSSDVLHFQFSLGAWKHFHVHEGGRLLILGGVVLQQQPYSPKHWGSRDKGMENPIPGAHRSITMYLRGTLIAKHDFKVPILHLGHQVQRKAHSKIKLGHQLQLVGHLDHTKNVNYVMSYK